MKLSAVVPVLLIVIGFISVIAIIWDQEFKNYLVIADNKDLPIDTELALDFLPQDRPSYIHFFSEDCRNARINISHIERIISKYDADVRFFVVNVSALQSEHLRKKYDLPAQVQIVDDPGGKLAGSLHVKSLPYALISRSDRRLFFGGNYNNKNGLCGSSEIIWSSPAVALKFLIKNQPPPLFPDYQLDFVGCGI